MANNNTVNLKELFSNKVFRIPNYQRGYSWGDRQLKDLWDDISDIAKDEDGNYISHYTGTIFLSATGRNEINDNESWAQDNQKFYNVVDGQQRLTTLVILLFELIRISPEGLGQDTQEDMMKSFICIRHKNQILKCYRFLYKDLNREYLLHEIFEDRNSSILPSEYENVYTKNLLYAKDFFKEKLKALASDDPEQLEELYRKLLTALIFDQRIIEKDLDVQAVFETMNNRGKPLTTLEKLKNRLIYLSNRFTNREEAISLQGIINNGWAKIFTELARNPDYLLPEDEFLSAFLSVYSKPEYYTFSEEQAEQKVFEMFCTRAEQYGETPVDFVKINNFVQSLASFARDWYSVHNTKNEMVLRILLQNGSKEMKVFLATIIHILENNDAANECLRLSELVLFRNSFMIADILDARQFASYARDIYAEPSNVGMVNTRLEERLAIKCEPAEFINGYRWLFGYTNGAKGYHRWGGLKYLLFCYEYHLKNEVYGEYAERVSWSDFRSVNIEHIIPQRYEANWPEIASEYLKDIPDENKWRASVVLINSLGNLTIIKDRKNSELQNDGWDKKRERYKTGYYSEQQVSESEKWTPLEVFKRGKDIYRFIESRISDLHFSEEELLDVLFSQEMYYPVEYRHKIDVPEKPVQ